MFTASSQRLRQRQQRPDLVGAFDARAIFHNPERIAAETMTVLQNRTLRQQMREEFQRVRELLGSQRPSATLAAAVAEELGIGRHPLVFLSRSSMSQYVH